MLVYAAAKINELRCESAVRALWQCMGDGHSCALALNKQNGHLYMGFARGFQK